VSVVNTHIRKRSPQRPAVLLLAGPTGTGKTKTAELLSTLLAKHTHAEWGFIRVDLNQMGEAHHANRLIGSPPGYIGYDDPLLFEPLMRQPRHVILFDEMEKAHPKVLQVLMNAMSNGRLECSRPIDGKREFSFLECVFLFTSNIPLRLGAIEYMSQLNITRACRQQLMQPMKEQPAMLPELAARFTDILLFRQLSDQDKVAIMALTIMRVAEQYNLHIRRIAPQLLQAVVDELSVSNGVREAENALESMFGAALADFADATSNTEAALHGTIDRVEVASFIQC
jgi:ATP-dependent Clp protease ATP-binding subunit ClpA